MTGVIVRDEGGAGSAPGPGDGERSGGRRFFLWLAAAVCVLLVLGILTWMARRGEYQALAAETQSLATLTVAVTHPTAQPAEEELTLPGTLRPYVESTIYARTNGYLRKWHHDIGSRVAKGELLAEIDTPEVDQQLSQARADLGTAEANASLASRTATRLQDVLKTDGVSKQEVDNAVGDSEAKDAALRSARANVRRLEDLESFKRIEAPFSGVLTRRNVDIGTLVNAGNGGQSQELFSLAQTDPIRVYVSVPEADAPGIRAGLMARLTPTQHAGEEFHGTVVRTAEALEPSTRTLLTEIDVPNGDGRLLPGGYAEVRLGIMTSGARLQVPVNALLVRSEGLRVAVVDAQHVAHLRPLTIGRDYGSSLEVLSGLEAQDWIVLNPADGLDEGQEVRVKEAQAAGASVQAAGSAKK
ncbi:MAG: efflux RND transporter periplasmic adaptor subunit [Vicinamibacteria bacterium]